ncbi:outer membrane beta-barrel protein [uncultured Bacteroides sp.]|uniref:outer membrane beta-barrel protein n=1 Tax=uncultured Bacteroides sp. TaxID=162156 RepID=UPI002635413E|nr:outer membrane beta-barrel protein [uncultured Bacteroides sp.]
MMKDEELWLKKIKERLDDYSEPLPDAGWERLERALTTVPPMSVRMKKKVQFRRWVMTAAAVGLVAVSSLSLWLVYSPMVDEVNRSVESVLAIKPDELPEQAKPSVRGEQPEPVIRRIVERGQASGRQPFVAQHLRAEEAKVNVHEDLSDEADARIADIDQEMSVSDETGKADEENMFSEKAPQETSSAQEKSSRRVYRPSGKDKLHLPAENRSSKRGKGWAVGLSVGNVGANTLLSDAEKNGMPGFAQSSAPLFSDKLNMSDISNGIMTIPAERELVFAGGVPYLQENTHLVRDIKHKQPVSFGVSVRKMLPKNFSVETGVTYTMLASEITYESGSEKITQKLHYMGIPVRANWNFVNNKNFTMYVSAGGTVEKCVYGKVGSEKETVDPLQLSVMGAVGAQYNVSNRVGIYVEPGVSYFFDDGSAIETIRKESPTNFTLQAGIRLTY